MGCKHGECKCNHDQDSLAHMEENIMVVKLKDREAIMVELDNGEETNEKYVVYNSDNKLHVNLFKTLLKDGNFHCDHVVD
jgi:hypothetical protein